MGVGDYLISILCILGVLQLSGTLILEDAEELILPTYADHFDALTLQPGQDIMIVRLESANSSAVIGLIGQYYATGNLIVRTVKLL